MSGSLGGRKVRRRAGYILLETVVATGLLVVGLAVIGGQVQDADTSVRKMERRMRAIMLAEQYLAELSLGLVELDSVDEEQEGDFGPRHPDYGWRLTTRDTALEGMVLLQVDILHHLREGEYKEDDYEYDLAESLHTVYAMRSVPRPIDFAEDFGLNEEEVTELSERLGKLGIAGLDPGAFDLSILGKLNFEELIESLPGLMQAMNIDLSQFASMIPPNLMQQLRDAGLLDGDVADMLGGGDEEEGEGP